ncbi:putative ribonuclease H-like domain-containing protein [Tanacetum coccineum]|uniref:Ribonuclease H-like domain-containing protein n=1 Tax=Tanacetum coccineum TaxID=301880 RepID=A0ABQ5GSG2_9ASTR
MLLIYDLLLHVKCDIGVIVYSCRQDLGFIPSGNVVLSSTYVGKILGADQLLVILCYRYQESGIGYWILSMTISGSGVSILRLDYKEIDGGYVAFGGNPKGGKITGKCTIKTVVTDDYSRFTWVFFLATKDETSGILKSFITGIENLIDHKVKVIRCDNGTEFKNREMNQFCEMKGILRQFSVAKTLQQNGVAERRNRTLIEAARTMLADSKLPTTF